MTFTSTVHEGQGLPTHRPELLDVSYVVVVPRTISYTPHGALYTERTPVRVVCDVEGKSVQAGMFANSGSEDTNMQTQGGLRELSDYRIMAREWPGDIASLIWIPVAGLSWPDGTPGGDLAEAVGQPTVLNNGSRRARHVQQMASLVADHTFSSMDGVAEHGYRMPDVPSGSRVWGR